MTSGTNVAPELRSVSDDSLIQGTLNTTIRTNERRALSEYISYYDDPNDDDNNLPTSYQSKNYRSHRFRDRSRWRRHGPR